MNVEKISYLGPKSSFSYIAARKTFDKRNSFISKESIEDIFSSVEQNKCEYGIVPIENSNAGSISATIDCLLVSKNIKIYQELYLKIKFHLIASSKLKFKEIKKIYSHYIAFEQCKIWLKSNLPKTKIKQAKSNSHAAQKSLTEKQSASIGNIESVKEYNLKIVKKNIHDYQNNVTRFLIISKKSVAQSTQNKTSIIAILKHLPGSLYNFLKPLAKNKINMTRIESRIMKKSNWEYCFFVDFEGHIKEETIKKTLSKMKKNCKKLKVLGSYPKSKI